MSILLNKTLRLFLDSIGRREEYEYYLERFSTDRSQAFAILVPDLDGFEEVAGVFAFDMRFLLQLGLEPVVLLCGTEAESMCTMLLEEDDHPFEIFRVNGLDWKDWLAKIPSALESARRKGKLLVLTLSAPDPREILKSLVPAVSRRVHFIRARGPLHDANGHSLFFYRVQQPVVLASEDQSLAILAGCLLEGCEGVHISVASPLQLLEELFTVKGAGCLIRRGAVIDHYRSVSDLDAERLVRLLESGFGRRLQNRGFMERASDFYVEAQYRGAAVLEPCGGRMYLSKFTVQTDARGEGLAQEIWREMEKTHRALFWRSNLRNPINQWYDRQADGCHRQGEWMVYWRGVSIDQIPSIIENALSRLSDFE